MKKIFSWRNYLVFYLILIILYNILLLEFPLTNVFGFEFSVLNAFLLVLLSGFLTLSLLSIKEDYKTFLKTSFSSFIYFLIIPLIVSLSHDFLTVSCSITDGFLFYTFITIPSVIIGASLAVLSVFVSRRFRYLIFISIFLAILSITFFEFYYNPQIYFYNPVYAYYPGTIYDEAISIDLKLIVYRSLNLLFFGTVYLISAYVIYKKTIISKKLIIYLTLLITAVFLYLSPSFGYSTTQNKLKSVLDKLVRTEHFDIYFSPGISIDKQKIIALNHEYYFKQLSSFYQVISKEKYTSFIFRDDIQKKKYFGSENADVAKPWLREIFIIADNYNNTLRHEIAHCFAGEFGWSIFRVAANFNPALIEGAAVAGAPEYDLNDVDYMASLAYRNGYKIRLQDLFEGLNFFGHTSGLSYIYAGSFCRYLIDNYGIGKFKKLYASSDFEEIYNKDIPGLSKEYFNFITDKYNAENRAEADYYYGRKPVIYKTCPRFVAGRLKEAWNYYLDKNYSEALDAFTEVLKLTDNYSALTGYAQSLFKTGREKEAIELLKSKLNDFKNTSYFYNIEFRLADFCAEVSDTLGADTLYRKIISENPNRILYYLSNLREKLLKEDTLIVPYIKGSDLDKYLIIRGLNNSSYFYYSIPVMVDLAETLGESYDLFLDFFDRTITVDSYQSSFAVYRLSVYLLSHLDITKARKMAALAMRYNEDKNWNYILRENYKKANWLYENSNKIN